MKKNKFTESKVCLLIPLFLIPMFAFAQSLITGKIITKNDQKPLSFVSVSIKGTNQGTSSGVDGNFSIRARQGDTLSCTGAGIQSENIVVDARNSYIIELNADATALNEVVVTALGIKKETKRIGYSVQEVKGAELVKAREPNAINGV